VIFPPVPHPQSGRCLLNRRDTLPAAAAYSRIALPPGLSRKCGPVPARVCLVVFRSSGFSIPEVAGAAADRCPLCLASEMPAQSANVFPLVLGASYIAVAHGGLLSTALIARSIQQIKLVLVAHQLQRIAVLGLRSARRPTLRPLLQRDMDRVVFPMAGSARSRAAIVAKTCVLALTLYGSTPLIGICIRCRHWYDCRPLQRPLAAQYGQAPALAVCPSNIYSPGVSGARCREAIVDSSLCPPKECRNATLRSLRIRLSSHTTFPLPRPDMTAAMRLSRCGSHPGLVVIPLAAQRRQVCFDDFHAAHLCARAATWDHTASVTSGWTPSLLAQSPGYCGEGLDGPAASARACAWSAELPGA